MEKLGKLVDEIAEFLSETNLKDYDAATFAGISNDPIYIPEHGNFQRSDLHPGTFDIEPNVHQRSDRQIRFTHVKIAITRGWR